MASGMVRQLIRGGFLGPDEGQRVTDHMSANGGSLKRAVIELGIMEEARYIDVLERAFEIPFLDLSSFRIGADALATVGEKLARRYNILPVMIVGNVLTIAVEDPFVLWLIDQLKNTVEAEVKFVIAEGDQIRVAIEENYGEQKRLKEAVDSLGGTDHQVTVEEGKEVLDLARIQSDSVDLPIVQVVNAMITQGVSRKASDIHLEPQEESTLLRYRIDGHLQEVAALPRTVHQAVVSRIKIMANLNITEHRVPQDGRIRVGTLGRKVDLRVSLIPLVHGEKVVIRILDQDRGIKRLEAMGWPTPMLAAYRRAIRADHGMILITGPTGSGKTTTLYSSLIEINKPDINIVTLEDPVEYRIKGINQVQLNPRAGMTFDSGLRSILRQDPDVILVGEIRDIKTAQTAFRASMTGHLLFSTLHTNSAIDTIMRLVNMGVDPFLVGTGLLCIFAQRLVRTICPKCKIVQEERPENLERFGLVPPIYAGKGCSFCRFGGHIGRMGIFESIFVDSRLRDLICQRANPDALEAAARLQEGYMTLYESGLDAVQKGNVPLDEILSFRPITS